MASQNVAPSSITSSLKSSGSSLAAPKDGHSVTKRLQQDLMKLMVTACVTATRGRVRCHCPFSHRCQVTLAYLLSLMETTCSTG